MSEPRPDDIRSSMLWYEERRSNGVTITGYRNPEANRPECDICWGSHGCARPEGHEGAHWCDCCDCENHPDHDSGCVAGPPYYGADTKFFSAETSG